MGHFEIQSFLAISNFHPVFHPLFFTFDIHEGGSNNGGRAFEFDIRIVVAGSS